jgi:hypothetical protein
VAYTGERSANRVLAGKLEGKKPLGRARRRWDLSTNSTGGGLVKAKGKVHPVTGYEGPEVE